MPNYLAVCVERKKVATDRCVHYMLCKYNYEAYRLWYKLIYALFIIDIIHMRCGAQSRGLNPGKNLQSKKFILKIDFFYTHKL